MASRILTADDRPLRADAKRNRGRLVAAATAAFREQGLDCGVAEIVRRAGVGTATLFRNFATKDDLILAVVEERLTEALEICERAASGDDPAASFDTMISELADLQARDLGFSEAIHSRLLDEPALTETKSRLMDVAGGVLRRAQRIGAIRADVVPEDLRHLMASAVCQSCTHGSAPKLYQRYLRIMLDGLRPAAASPLPGPAPAPAPRAE